MNTRCTGGVGVVLVVAGLIGGLVATAPAADAATAQGPWVWPLDRPSVTRPFAPPAQRYGTGHRGVDLAAGSGVPVRAAGAGRVSYAGLLAGRGVVVVVHGDLRTTYEPVSALVSVGEPVRAGEVLGRVTGLHPSCSASSGSCLHWGLLRDEVYLDPLSLVRRGPSRLLPVPAPRSAAQPDRVDPVPARLLGDPQPSLPVLAPAPATDQGWSLRSARTGSAGGALLALLLGLALLIRRPPKPDPDAPAVAQLAPRSRPREDRPEVETAVGRSAVIVDLTAQRARRRA